MQTILANNTALRHRILLLSVAAHPYHEPWKTFEFRATRCNTINHFYPRQNIGATIPRVPQRISISRSYFSQPPFHASRLHEIFNSIILPWCKNNPRKKREKEKERGRKEACQAFISLSLFFIKIRCTLRTLFNPACAPRLARLGHGSQLSRGWNVLKEKLLNYTITGEAFNV